MSGLKSLAEKSKLAEHAYEEGQRANWNWLRFYKLKLTVGIGTKNNQSVWCI
jgi:hypothetical protein